MSEQPASTEQSKERRETVRISGTEKTTFDLWQKGILFVDFAIDPQNVASFNRIFAHIITTRRVENDSKLKPLWIYLSSPGGTVHNGLGVYDMIRGAVEAGVEINILGFGLVASMSAAIMQAASKRYALPNTQFLIHQISQIIVETSEEVNVGEERIRENKRINQIVMNLIAERSGMDLRELLRISKKKDCWYSAKEATQFGQHGLIDEVITKLPILLP